jgi:hypothetical protein
MLIASHVVAKKYIDNPMIERRVKASMTHNQRSIGCI